MMIYIKQKDYKNLIEDLITNTGHNEINLSLQKLHESIFTKYSEIPYINLEFSEFLLLKFVQNLYNNFEFKTGPY